MCHKCHTNFKPDQEMALGMKRLRDEPSEAHHARTFEDEETSLSMQFINDGHHVRSRKLVLMEPSSAASRESLPARKPIMPSEAPPLEIAQPFAQSNPSSSGSRSLSRDQGVKQAMGSQLSLELSFGKHFATNSKPSQSYLDAPADLTLLPRYTSVLVRRIAVADDGPPTLSI
jgi:hypothetical protein